MAHAMQFQEITKMQINPRTDVNKAQRQTPGAPQMHVRSDLRAGVVEDCTLGLSYWRKEYNRLKQYAETLGCS
jgi:hypothetical protein